MSDSGINADEAEIARIMCRLPELSWLHDAETNRVRRAVRHEIAEILHQYCLENTQNHKTGWSERFRQAGISEDNGKSAISCARRLGLNIG